MKHLLIALLFAQVLFAHNGFEKGNALYRNEKYAEAASAYESVLKENKQSAELYFNLANAYYKQNKVAPAIYNYEKALLLKPNDPEITNNLNFAHKMMIDEIKEVPRVGFRKIIEDVTSSMSYDGWAWTAVVLAFSFLLFFCGYYFSGIALYKRIFFVGMFVIAFAILICTISALFERDREKNDRPAIVFEQSAPVKSEPKSSGADATVLHEGTKVYVLETLDNWKKVVLPDGSQGWMEVTSIKEIK
ncbi:MAG: tetratricopeptide repeat protein [Flavobacterium sp.]|nr:MAG: tetratricopeptide repeat protein [Flavobacterium sp.]